MHEEEAKQERRRKTTTCVSVEKKHKRIISRGEESENDDDSEDDDDGKEDEEEKDEALNTTRERKMVKNNDDDNPVAADAAAAALATTTTTVEKNETNGEDEDEATTNETTGRRRLRALRNDSYVRKGEHRQNRFGVPATALVTSVVHTLREASRALIDHLSEGRDEAERIFEKIGSSAEETKCAAHEIENASKEIGDLLHALVDAGVRAKEEEKVKKNIVRGGGA